MERYIQYIYMNVYIYIHGPYTPPFKRSLENCMPSGRDAVAHAPHVQHPPTCSKTEEGTEHKPWHILSVFINAVPNLHTHHPAFTHSSALLLPAPHDARGGLLEDIAVSCCEAVATYVCTTWFPRGNRLIGCGCWSLSPICEPSLNLDIVSPQGKTHHRS